MIEFVSCLLKMDNQVGKSSPQKLCDHKNRCGMLKQTDDDHDDGDLPL